MELNAQQKTAVEYNGGHVLVLAGAGTGKTRTIIARAAHLIEKGVEARRILLLTFTRRAAAEMVDRLRRMIGEESSRVMAGTFHHFCLYTMRRMPTAFGIETATIIDRDDQNQLMKLVRANYRKKGEIFPKASELVTLNSYARNTNQPADQYLQRHSSQHKAIADRICKSFKDYETRKRESNYLDFDDILFLFAKK